KLLWERSEPLVHQPSVNLLNHPAAITPVTDGTNVYVVWGPLSENPWMTSVREVLAEIVDIPPSDPEAPGAFRYAESSKLLTLLDRAGFRELNVRDWRGDLRMGGGMPAAEAAHFALAS